MKIKIYQIDMDRDENRVKFCRFEILERLQGSSKVNPEIYDLVYASDVDCKNLEDVYATFNLNHPVDFRGHSLSVSDVVEIGEGEAIAKGICDYYGVSTEEKTEAEKNNASSKDEALYIVQAGAFSKKANAEDYVKKLKKAGFEAIIVKSN